MLIFVNNKSVKIYDSENNPKSKYDKKYDLFESDLEFGLLKGKVLVLNANYRNIIQFIEHAQNYDLPLLKSIDFEVKNRFKIKYKLVTELYLIKAAGGIVINANGKKLLMKRLGFWDLPKGKAEKRETSVETAQREVEEECGVLVKVKDKICTSWHTYTQKGRLVIKQTKWYKMDLVSDENMEPQEEEGIEELKWMNESEVENALKNSYASIGHVLQKFKEKF